MSEAPAADQVLAVLAFLARQPEPVPASRVARGLGLARSSTYRLLGVLVEHGLVAHLAEERCFGLGPAAHELGSAYQRQAPLQRIARPVLHRLVDETTHNAHLSVLHGRDVLYLIEERAAGRPLLVTDVGVRLPAPLTASGLAMLARLPARQVRALFPDAASLVRLHGQGPRTPTELRRMLTDTRASGFAAEDGTVTAGLASVAQPVCDHTGYPVAAVAVTYPVAGTDAAAVRRLLAATTAAAALLSRRLHGTAAPRDRPVRPGRAGAAGPAGSGSPPPPRGRTSA